jgi:AraC family transcriptional activator FtrA
VASLAERAGMGQRTFLRRFEDATGKTPARWLLDERLQRATQHLTHSRLSVEQIAELCGFSNASTLRHHFRQQFALSPLQYRKSALAGKRGVIHMDNSHAGQFVKRLFRLVGLRCIQQP